MRSDRDLVDLVREHVAAFNDHDAERVAQGLSPEVEWTSGADRFVGHDEVAAVMREAMSALAPSLELRSLVAGGEQVAAEMIERYRYDGAEKTAAIAAFFVFDGDLIARVKVYREGSADP